MERENNKFRIGIDASGGDFAPSEIIKGTILASSELSQELVLIGRRSQIEKELKGKNREFNIVDAPEQISMAEAPVAAVRKKRKSSIVVGCRLLKEGKIDAFVSCGNTGAVVGASTLILKLIEGVERPGIALRLPARNGISLLIDAGANIDCKSFHLLQYGVMASVYCNTVLDKKNPSIGILNIGEEASKGLGVLKKTHKLFEETSLNFYGNIEAKKILSGIADCIVCDGFVGNVALKVLESGVETMGKVFIESMKRNLLGRFSLLLARGNFKRIKKVVDYSEYGGAPLLGVDGVVIIGHGRSDAKAVKNAVGAAVRELKGKLNQQIRNKIHEVCQNNRIRQILAA